METMADGIVKVHIGCGGEVQYRENLNYGKKNFQPPQWWEWNLYCTVCDRNLTDEEVEIKKKE